MSSRLTSPRLFGGGGIKGLSAASIMHTNTHQKPKSTSWSFLSSSRSLYDAVAATEGKQRQKTVQNNTAQRQLLVHYFFPFPPYDCLGEKKKQTHTYIHNAHSAAFSTPAFFLVFAVRCAFRSFLFLVSVSFFCFFVSFRWGVM